MLRKAYADKASSEDLLRASDLDWTLEYPGALNDRECTPSAAVADFFLHSTEEGTFIRQIAVVTDTKETPPVVPVDPAGGRLFNIGEHSVRR